MKVVPSLPSRPLPEQLSERVGLEDEGVALADAGPVQRRESSFKQGADDAFAPRFGRDGQMMDVPAPAVGSAEDGADEVFAGYGDTAQSGVAG